MDEETLFARINAAVGVTAEPVYQARRVLEAEAQEKAERMAQLKAEQLAAAAGPYLRWTLPSSR